MSQQSLLIRVAQALDQASIDYMLTGSAASSIHGEPRSTHDIDLVIALESHSVDGLLASFPGPDFYLSGDAIRGAMRDRSMFNLIDMTTGDKVDFWMLTDEPFDQCRFGRRQPIDFVRPTGSRFQSRGHDTAEAALLGAPAGCRGTAALN